jgi:hypothetical protein
VLGLNAQGLLFPSSLYTAFCAIRHTTEGQRAEDERKQLAEKRARALEIVALAMRARDMKLTPLYFDVADIEKLLNDGAAGNTDLGRAAHIVLGLNAQGLLFPKSLYNAFNARQRAEGELSEYEELSAYMNHGRRDQINASSVSDRDKERDHLREDLLAVVRLLGLGPPPPFMSTVGLSREESERVSQKRAAFVDFLQAAQFHRTKKKKKGRH